MLRSGSSTAHLPACAIRLLFVLLALSAPTPELSAQQPGTKLEDRILAVVDEDPILESDVERVVILGLVEPAAAAEGGAAEDQVALRRRVLEELIEQRLRYHEVERFGFEQVPPEAVEAEVEALEDRLGGPQALTERLAQVKLDENGLRQLLARQLLVLTYIEERLGPRIFIRREDVQAYYQDVLVPELTAARGEVPSLEAVREQIRLVLREQRLNEEITQWTAELRSEANVQLFLEPPGDLPPVVRRIE